jgi:hypothetical protein
MRISNKISINGDTLLIFEQKTEMQLKQIAMQIYKELSRKFSGSSYDVMDELEAMKKAGILDSEEQNIISTYLRDFGDENNPINQSISEAPSMEEGSFNPMKSKKLYFHVLEDGGYGRIGHQGYYNTEAEAKKRAADLQDMFPKSFFYVEAYPSKREPVTVTMEEGSFNPMKNSSKGLAISNYEGNIITWNDYEVEESNIDGGGYTDAVTLFGKDKLGNSYTAIANMTNGVVDKETIEDIDISMESSTMNESLESLSDNELMDLAYDEGMEELIVKNPEGGIENRGALIAALNQSNEPLNEAKEKKAPADKKKADKTNYGNKDMSDVDMVNPYELKKGIRIEMVDTEDYEKAMDKVVKKLKKDPMFYSNLIANAKETKGKRADVPTEVKDKKLNKVSDKMKDKANEMEVSKKDATKKNANDSLNKKEKMSGKPKGVKEMTMTPKKSKGMKSMDVPGKEKKTNLKESFNLWDSFKKNILR